MQSNIGELLAKKYEEDLKTIIDTTDLTKEEIENAISKRLEKKNSYDSYETMYCH